MTLFSIIVLALVGLGYLGLTLWSWNERRRINSSFADIISAPESNRATFQPSRETKIEGFRTRVKAPKSTLQGIGRMNTEVITN